MFSNNSTQNISEHISYNTGKGKVSYHIGIVSPNQIILTPPKIVVLQESLPLPLIVVLQEVICSDFI
jgi:hypothetical protein